MFEITPSSEFSAWFEALPPALAEEVACALDLLAEAGTALGPSRTSRALLWYDGTGGGPRHDLRFWGRTLASVLDSYDDVRELLLWQREVVRCLDSIAFAQRLAQLDPKAAALALAAVENLRIRLKAVRAQLALQQAATRPVPLAYPLSAFSALTAREERLLEQRFSPSNGLKEAFFEVLRLVGLEPSQVMNSTSGLAELTIPSTDPPLRVLFGLDAPGRRIVVLLGESLTRRYYGDSVKVAEQRWLQYCSSPAAESVVSESDHE